jgi:hypothetical protein
VPVRRSHSAGSGRRTPYAGANPPPLSPPFWRLPCVFLAIPGRARNLAAEAGFSRIAEPRTPWDRAVLERHEPSRSLPCDRRPSGFLTAMTWLASQR